MGKAIVKQNWRMAGEARVAIIGGTGIGERLAKRPGTVLHVPTERGLMRGRLISHDGVEILAVARHSSGHSTPPHAVNYAAMALGMKAIGIRACLSTAAVGSLRPEWGPGCLVVCSDFLDFTGRNLTLFNRTVVHRDFSAVMSPARSALIESAGERGLPIRLGVYLAANGPRYETPAEIRTFRTLGGDIVGMTASSEAILMGEAMIDYACLAIVTNFAAGLSPAPLDHQEVVDQMRTSGDAAVEILLAAATRLEPTA